MFDRYLLCGLIGYCVLLSNLQPAQVFTILDQSFRSLDKHMMSTLSYSHAFLATTYMCVSFVIFSFHSTRS